jgi:hypothetical protein
VDRKPLRTPDRCRRVLYEICALPEGTLPLELDDAVEDLPPMPGYRERLLAAFLGLPPTPQGEADEPAAQE